jgi:hypothetical protein
LYKITLSDQTQGTLHLKVHLSDLKSGFLAVPPFMGGGGGSETFIYPLLAALVVLHGSLKYSRNRFISEKKTKQYNQLSYSPFKIVPLCNNTLLPATVKFMGTFLEAIL